MFWFLLGTRHGRRHNPTPDSNPNPNPDPRPRPKRANTGHKRGCAAFASNQENFRMRTMIPECRDRATQFSSQKQVKNTPKDHPFSQTAKPTTFDRGVGRVKSPDCGNERSRVLRRSWTWNPPQFWCNMGSLKPCLHLRC